MGLIAGTSLMAATTINIPNNSFEGLSGTLDAPIVGTTSNNFGAWSAQVSVVVGLGGQMSVVTGGTPFDGNSQLKLSVPAGVGATESISQTLTNKYLPNSIYKLSVALSQGAVANLISGTSLNLNAGNVSLGTMGGTQLAAVLNSGTGYQTATLVFKTGNTVPTNNIGISLVTSSVVGVSGNIYVDNFQLTVEPINVQLGGAVKSGTNMAVNLTGGAANGTFVLYTTTNVFSPASNWVPCLTNQFDAQGNFSTDVKFDPNTPARYFRVVLP